MGTRPGTIKVWNGTAEVPATLTVWNGTAEVAASLEVVVDEETPTTEVVTNTAEGGTNAAVVTAATSGGVSGDAFDVVSGSPTFASAGAHSGSLGYALPAGTAVASVAWTITASAACAAQMWFKITAWPAADARILDFRDTTPATVGGLLVMPTGRVRLMQLTSSIATTESPVLSLNTWYRLGIALKNGTAGAGTYKIGIYAADGSTVHMFNGAFNGTAAPITTVRFGRPSTSSIAAYFDDLTAEAGRDTLLGEVVTPPVGYTKPDASNTGHTGVLATYAGPSTITANNTLVENKEIRLASITVKASNVTFRNCLFRGDGTTSSTLIAAWDPLCVNLLVEDCTFAPDFVGLGNQGIHGHDYTVRRCDVSRVVDGFGCFRPAGEQGGANVLIESNWVHGLHCMLDAADSLGITHNDCVQIHGSGGVHIYGNTLTANPGSSSQFVTSPQGTATGGMSCVMMTPSTTYGSDCPDVRIEDNWLDYGSACLNLNRQSTAATSQATVLNNKYGRNGARTGLTGYRILRDATLDCPGLPTTTGPDTTNGNVYEDTGLPVTVNVSGVVPPPTVPAGYSVYPTGAASFDAGCDAATKTYLPAGTYSFSDFAKSTYFGAALNPCVWVKGASKASTLIKMTSNTSTKAAAVAALAPGSTNPYHLLAIGSGSGRGGGPVIKWEDFTLVGTPQGHVYGGLRMNYGAIGSVMRNVKITGIPGNDSTPPGETFAANLYNCLNVVVDNCEFDGRLNETGSPVTASMLGLNNADHHTVVDTTFKYCGPGFPVAAWQCTDGDYTRCTFDHNNRVPIHIENCDGVWNFRDCIWTNSDPTEYHGVFAASANWASGEAVINIYDPVYDDIRGDGKFWWRMLLWAGLTYNTNKGTGTTPGAVNLYINGVLRPDLLEVKIG